MQKFIQTYIIFKERVILRIVKLFFHNNLTDSKKINFKLYFPKESKSYEKYMKDSTYKINGT